MEQRAALKPDAESAFFTFGATMLSVQNFERSLATLVVVLGRSRRTRELKTPEALARALQRALDRSLPTYQRASAAELRRKLPDDFDPQLMEEIEVMVSWRDKLARRYLVEKLVLDGGPTLFQPGTAEELMEVGIGFSTLAGKLSGKVNEEVAAMRADRPAADAPPDALAELIESLAPPVMFGEPWEPPK